MADSPSSLPPLVAVVTPVYNGAAFLEGAIRAVKSQTYPRVVHVLLDNASTDATAQIIARYAAEAGPKAIARLNTETLPQAENFNAAVKHVPREAAWFTMLCADDIMKPGAISEMMALAARDPSLVLIGGRESVNNELRPACLPEETAIFEASNAAARVLVDDARLPFPHVLYRRDFLRDDADFFDINFTAFDTEVALRILSQGGRFGFVHKHLFDNTHHKGALTATVVKKQIPYIWEQLLFIERYGPGALTNNEFKRVRKKHLRVVNRRMLFWMFAARGNYKRDQARLQARGLAPSFASYLDALIAWPGHILTKTARPNDNVPWPDDALRPAADTWPQQETVQKAG